MFTSAKLKTIKLTYKFSSFHLIFFNLSVCYLNLSLIFVILAFTVFYAKSVPKCSHTLVRTNYNTNL